MDEQTTASLEGHSQDSDPLDPVGENAFNRATQKLHSLDLPGSINLPKNISFLGPLISDNYAKQHLLLADSGIESVSRVMAYAVKLYWHSAWQGAYWMEEAILANVARDTKAMREKCTVEGYARSEGGAWLLYSRLSETQQRTQKTVLSDTALSSIPDAGIVLTAIACYWLYLANQSIESNQTSNAFDLIHEAYDALALRDGDGMCEGFLEDLDDGLATRDEFESAIRSRIGKAAAAARLSKDPKQKAKAWVLGCWEAWQDRPDSYPSQAAFARSMLEKELGLTSQPTIEAWCRDWKKQKNNPHPAGIESTQPAQ